MKSESGQESPPAWTQEGYRPPCSKYSLCFSVSLWGGGVLPVQGKYLPIRIDILPSKVGTPSTLVQGRYTPSKVGIPLLGVNRQTPVKTVPSPFLRNAGGKNIVGRDIIRTLHYRIRAYWNITKRDKINEKHNWNVSINQNKRKWKHDKQKIINHELQRRIWTGNPNTTCRQTRCKKTRKRLSVFTTLEMSQNAFFLPHFPRRDKPGWSWPPPHLCWRPSSNTTGLLPWNFIVNNYIFYNWTYSLHYNSLIHFGVRNITWN